MKKKNGKRIRKIYKSCFWMVVHEDGALQINYYYYSKTIRLCNWIEFFFVFGKLSESSSL